jgi:hypothetical protein
MRCNDMLSGTNIWTFERDVLRVLKMVDQFFEISEPFYRASRRHIPEDISTHDYKHENPK